MLLQMSEFGTFTVWALWLRRSWKWVVTPAMLSAGWWYVSVHMIMVPSRINMEDLEGFYRAFPDGYASARYCRPPQSWLARKE